MKRLLGSVLRLHLPTVARRGIRLSAALWMLLNAAHAQQDAAATAPLTARLQQAIADQQAALRAGDSSAIVAKSRRLAALALASSGALYRAQHRNDEAAAALNRSLAVESTPQLRSELIVTYLDAKQPAEASRIIAETVQAQGDTVETRFLIASSCHAADDLACTLQQLQKAVQLDPGAATAHLALGEAFWEQNEYQYNADSLREFTAAQQLQPAAYQTNYDLGAILSQYQRYADAEKPLRSAAAAMPASPDPWLQLGMNAFAQGLYQQAEPLLRRAVELTGSDLAHNQYQVRRAFAALSRIDADKDPARAEADAARDAAIHTAMAQEAVAPALSQSTGLVTNSTAEGRAETHPAKDADHAQGNDATQQELSQLAAQSLNDAGTALAQSRDYAGALPLFRMAAQTDAELPPVLRNLGLAAFHTGNLTEAAKAFQTWLQSHPDDALAQRYLQQIAAGSPNAKP